ncbi:hypothetical protein GCM10023224_05500 [Streptomonospora halophila]|uniref:Uncharacterized protein n=1 Tax=Streptomonospora halophila TaxID=427369 RepID=A0ABP9GC20_9ACTN
MTRRHIVERTRSGKYRVRDTEKNTVTNTLPKRDAEQLAASNNRRDRIGRVVDLTEIHSARRTKRGWQILIKGKVAAGWEFRSLEACRMFATEGITPALAKHKV